MTVYKAELAVASQSVSVSQGSVATSNIASRESVRVSLSLLKY